MLNCSLICCTCYRLCVDFTQGQEADWKDDINPHMWAGASPNLEDRSCISIFTAADTEDHCARFCENSCIHLLELTDLERAQLYLADVQEETAFSERVQQFFNECVSPSLHRLIRRLPSLPCLCCPESTLASRILNHSVCFLTRPSPSHRLYPPMSPLQLSSGARTVRDDVRAALEQEPANFG